MIRLALLALLAAPAFGQGVRWGVMPSSAAPIDTLISPGGGSGYTAAVGGAPTATSVAPNQRMYADETASGKVLASSAVALAGGDYYYAMGTGTSNNPDFPSRWLYGRVGADSLSWLYATTGGVLAAVPGLGGTVSDAYEQGSEHNAVSACGSRVSHVNDDNEVGGVVGHHWHDLSTGTFGTSTLYGVAMNNGAKSAQGAWSADCSMLSIYEHGNSWPKEVVSFDGGETFHTPSVSGSGSASVDNAVPAIKAWAGDTLWIWNQRVFGDNNGALLGKGYEILPDSFHVEAVCQFYECVFDAADLDSPISGSVYGPNPAAGGVISAETYGADLFIPVTGKYLYVWSERSTARRVEAKLSGVNPQTHYFAHQDSLYKLEPDGDIRRLVSMAAGPGDATPTWQLVSTISAPSEFDLTYGYPSKIEPTPTGALIVYTNRVMTIPYYGSDRNLGVVAYWAPGTALPGWTTPP